MSALLRIPDSNRTPSISEKGHERIFEPYLLPGTGDPRTPARTAVALPESTGKVALLGYCLG